jgi:hypothetical protein
MNSNAVKELMYGGIHQLMKNRQYYYHSAVGASYCHWTEEGKEALADYINLMGHKLLEAEEIELNQRAKNLVINGLKGEQV